MAIRDIVSRGFGNGTYDPGVNDLPTRGYTIGVVAPVTPPTVPGIEYTLRPNRLHYTLEANRLHYTADGKPLHFTLEGNRLHFTLPPNRLHYTLDGD